MDGHTYTGGGSGVNTGRRNVGVADVGENAAILFDDSHTQLVRAALQSDRQHLIIYKYLIPEINWLVFFIFPYVIVSYFLLGWGSAREALLEGGRNVNGRIRVFFNH